MEVGEKIQWELINIMLHDSIKQFPLLIKACKSQTNYNNGTGKLG